MNKFSYLKEVSKIRAHVDKECTGLHEITSPQRYHFLQSKSTRNIFLPDLQTDDDVFFRELMFHTELAIKDQELPYAYEHVTLKGNTAFLDENKPVIYCTFHLGSYRLINFFLYTHKIDYALMISQKTFEAEQQHFHAIHKTIEEKYAHAIQFKVLNAESETVAMQMIREVRKGNSLLFYIDGNTGAGGTDRKDDKLVAIDFLGQTLLARKGIAFLSHYLNIPVIPVISYRRTVAEPILQFFDPIYPTPETDRDTYCRQTTQEIWNIFARYLKKYPEQWEGWLYASHFLSPTDEATPYAAPVSVEDNSYYTFARNTYSLFANNQGHYLYHNQTTHCIKVSDTLFKFLNKIEQNNIDIEGKNLKGLIHESLLNNLIQTSIFAKV